MKPSLRDAYDRLGLSPFGEFLNMSSGDARLGATTWMLVEAALAIIEGHDVVIVGRRLEDAYDHAKVCLSYVLKLQQGPVQAVRSHSLGAKARVYTIRDGGHLYWESHQTVRRFWLGRRREAFKVFTDVEFHAMALQRRDGPFGEIHRLVMRPDGSFGAYTKLDEYLFDLTDEGARQMSDADPYRIVVED